MLLVFGLLCLESTLFLAFVTGRLETRAFINLHLALCAATATFGLWWAGAASTAADADDKIASVLQSVAWTVLAGPFGTVVAAALLVPRKAGASDAEVAASRPGLTRLELLHGSLLDSRMRLERAHAIRPLLDVIIEGTQLEKFDALSLISKRYDPALAPALRRALEDKDASVRVLAATVLAQQNNAHTKRIGALQAVAKADAGTSSDWSELGQAHFDYAVSGLLEASRAEIEVSHALDYLARAAELDPGNAVAAARLVTVRRHPTVAGSRAMPRTTSTSVKTGSDRMAPEADVCLIVEGGYPYLLGGVSSWTDAFMRASPGLKFYIIAISISAQPRIKKFVMPDNVVGLTDVILDVSPAGRAPAARDGQRIDHAVRLMQSTLAGDAGTSFDEFIDLVRQTGFGQSALLNSKPAWTAMERVYQELLNDGPLIDFFWTWRFLARSLLAIVTAPLPNARVFHAVSTGYAGVVGAYAQHVTGRPYVVTEHGIYTNERRIELSIADWIFDFGASGFTVGKKPTQLRDIWLTAFTNFSRISYAHSDVIITQYRANQDYQRFDGAPQSKLRIIPNGIDIDQYAGVHHSTEPRPPTVVMIGRIVPIKDTRTFIMAASLLKDLVPNVVAILIGPEEEDPAYAAGCRELVAQLGLESTVQFLGRVPDVMEYLGRST